MWQVHFDCVYRSITAVSSRESKILAGNRTIAQVHTMLFVLVVSGSMCPSTKQLPNETVFDDFKAAAKHTFLHQ